MMREEVPRLRVIPFIYGGDDGHLESILALATRFNLHPAHTYSVVRHRDVAALVRLALNGVTDGRIVNLTDDAPVAVWEMARLAGDPIEGSTVPLGRVCAARETSSNVCGVSGPSTTFGSRSSADGRQSPACRLEVVVNVDPGEQREAPTRGRPVAT